MLYSMRLYFWLFSILFMLDKFAKVFDYSMLDKIILKYRCTHGYEFYARGDDYRRFIDHFEPKTTTFVERVINDNDIVVDIGAHIGIHTIHFAKRAKLVIALEPEPQNFSLLKKNIKLNKVRNVITLPIALSDKNGYSYLFVSTSSGAHTLEIDHGVKLNVKFIDKIHIKTMTFDTLIRDLGIDKVDIVKIDVEGHEDKVLQGMKETLKNNPPRIIIVETDKDSSIIGELKNYGYCLFAKLDSWGIHINYVFILCTMLDTTIFNKFMKKNK